MIPSEVYLYNYLCKLDDGRLVEYDGACGYEASKFYTPDRWEFIGTGVIYSINGVLQNSTEQCRFYIRRQK